MIQRVLRGSPVPPGVRAVLEHLHAGASKILAGRFVGLYVDGSLALGDFDARRSDIDVVVAYEGEIDDRDVASSAGVHATIPDPRWRHDVEASYLPKGWLRRFDPADRMHPRIERGRDETLDRAPHDEDWVIHRYVLREHGIVVAGPDPRTLIDPVSEEDLCTAVRAIWRTWWEPMLDDPTRLDPGYQAYAVLSSCRGLYTLAHGRIASKPVAARWARERLPDELQVLVDRALAGFGIDDVEATQALIRHTVEQMR